MTNWIDLPKEDRERAIAEIELLARSITPHPIYAILNAAAAFLQASNEEPFAEQIRTEMAGLRLLYHTWVERPSEQTWREALSACVTLHYLIRRTHPDRAEFETIRQTLVEQKPRVETMGHPPPNPDWHKETWGNGSER